jgi:hypothetical protein
MPAKKTTKRTPITAAKAKKTATTRTPASTTQSTTQTTRASLSKLSSGTPKSRVVLTAKGPSYTAEDIATRAYFLNLERGGNPDENWKQAEAEFQAGLWS